jgi:hypothetical protein
MRQDSEEKWMTEAYKIALQALLSESANKRASRKIYTDKLNAKIKSLKQQIKELRRRKA